MKKQKIQMIVLLIVLGAAILAYFGIRAMTQKKEASEQAPSYTAYTVDPKNIANITCHNQAGSFALDYDADKDRWTFTDEPNEVVDQSQAKLLADALKEVTSDNDIKDVKDPEDYGFGENPTMTIDLTMKDGTKTTLYVGSQNSAISEYYFRVGDSDTIYTVSNTFFTDFNVDQPSLVSKDSGDAASSSSSDAADEPQEAASSSS